MKALEYGVVLAICRNESSPMPGCRLRDQFTTDHESFLVRQDDLLAFFYCREGRDQASCPNHCDDDEIGFGKRCHGLDSFLAAEEFGVFGKGSFIRRGMLETGERYGEFIRNFSELACLLLG